MSILAGIPDDLSKLVLASARRHRYGRREVIFHEGDPADTMHFIVKGQVAVRVTTARGDSATLDILGPGDPLGELALLPPAGVRSATAQALTVTETMVVGASAFADLQQDHPAVTELLLMTLVARNRSVNGRLVEALYVPVEARLIRRLLDVAARFGDGDTGTTVALSQDDLAGLAGTTRETANRVLAQLAAKGLVAVSRGRVELLDTSGLEKKSR